LRKAIGQNGTPETITIDKSGANAAAIESDNTEREADIEIRQAKYLNNIVEQNHRPIKRQVRPTPGFKSFRSAAVTLAGIELMHMIRKGQRQGNCIQHNSSIPWQNALAQASRIQPAR
jgi:transposase-like protein